MTLEERIRQLRQAQTQLPEILSSAAESATLRAIETAVDKTPPTMDDLTGTNTRTGELKQHWMTDSRTRPVQQGGQYVTELNNDKQYASYVNDGHRMDKHFVPGLYVNESSGLLEYDSSKPVGIMVGTKTKYVPGLHITDAAEQTYRETLRAELPSAVEELLK